MIYIHGGACHRKYRYNQQKINSYYSTLWSKIIVDTYWFNKLLDLLKVQTNSENEKLMVLYLDKELRKLNLPYTIDAAGNILVTKGKAKTYPCVVSHMDTVHSFVPNFKIYKDVDDDDLYFAMSGKKRVGIGGDDKCGIFACLYLLKKIPDIKIVFFSREEIGCKGSRNIDKGFFADCRYLIQLDRKGKGDFIQTYWGKKTISHEFSSEVGLIKKKYKYKNKIGTVTDVMTLWNNKVGISCINLSCGYYQPHSDCEYISVRDLWNSVKFTEEIVNTMQPKKYTSLPPAITVVSTSAVTSSWKSKYSQCCVCKAWKKDALLYEIKDGMANGLMCWPCKKDQYTKDKKNDMQVWDKNTGGSVIFACFECGIKTSEMKAGDSLKYIGLHMYCNNCASLFNVPDKKDPVVTCELCQEIIPEGYYRTTINDMLVCGVCACTLDEYTPKSCFVCNKVIPKDHKTIERFGVRICEDCACPSDTIILEN